MDARDIKHWQSMTFADADRMSAWLGAIGFREHAAHRDDTDPSIVVHGEWVWPGGAGIMGGSATGASTVAAVGASSLYLVADDPGDLFDRAVAAGATVDTPMTDKDYGGRGGSVRDPEGNTWSFGSYQPS
jgi:uncharacterized glyoxalase superfamily protein PhnB